MSSLSAINLGRCFLLALLMPVWALGVYAQVPDSSAMVAPDSSEIVFPDSGQARPRRASGPPLGFERYMPGAAVLDSLPARRPVYAVTELLDRTPGSFLYRFSTPGWPDGWSWNGLPPSQVTLLLDGVPFDDLITGRPRFDLLRVGFIQPPRLENAYHGASVAVHTAFRPADTGRPLTELRYWTGADGLQSIDAVHHQLRRRSLFGREGLLGLSFGYGGRAVSGEYPGSALRRERSLLGRLRYQQEKWSLELRNLHNRRRIGAHGGVIARPGTSLYERFDATVRNPEAKRFTLRNDLSMTLALRTGPAPASPLVLTSYWTTQSSGYRNATDTLEAKAGRIGVQAGQQLRWGPHTVLLRADMYTDAYEGVDGAASRWRTSFSAADSLEGKQVRLMAKAEISSFGTDVYPAGLFSVRSRAEAAYGFAEMQYGGRPNPWVLNRGYGWALRRVEGSTGGAVSSLRFGGGARSGAVDGLAYGFAHRIGRLVDVFSMGGLADTAIVRRLEEPVVQVGGALDVGWRRNAVRGMYLVLQPTLVRLLNRDAAADQERLAYSLPALYGHAYIGAHFRLFKGDLDMNPFLRIRAWSSMRSRALHPATGLLVLPEATASSVGPSASVDLVVEARLRDASLFLEWENILSGTPVMPGNMIVPVYPLAESSLRFGVFWPIFD